MPASDLRLDRLPLCFFTQRRRAASFGSPDPRGSTRPQSWNDDMSLSRFKTAFCTGLAAALSLAASPAQAGWPDTPVARLAVLATLQTLNADLLSHDSATLTLDRWCARHQLATQARIVAERVKDATLPAPPEVRAALRVGSEEPIAYRRVRLRCGENVLSEANNWFVPARLTPAMNAALATSDVPFGRVVQPLGFRRHTVSARLLWSPLPEDWNAGSALPSAPKHGAVLAIPDKLLEHRAVLTSAAGEPFSYVVETYTSAILNFPPPAWLRRR